MQVKVFESENMSAALKMVRETLGPDALILSTRTLRKGKLGIFGRPVLEVTAAAGADAAEVSPPASVPPAVARVPVAAGAGAFEAYAGRGAEKDLSYQDLWKQKKVIDPLEEEIQSIKDRLAGQDFSLFRGDLDEIKALVREIALSNLERQRPAPAKGGEGPVDLQKLIDVLTERGIASDVALTIGQFAREKFTPGQLQDPAHFLPFCRTTVGELIPIAGPLRTEGGRQKRVALVGPTGVGKTTTLAKLAAEYLLKKGRQGKKAALITIDTVRIAAVEQLKVYGGIMNLPVEVVFSPEQLQQALGRHADKDLILIDTAGRSPRDEVSLKDLQAFLGPETAAESHLVLSASTGDRGMEEAVRRFGRLPLQSLIFTKLDECDRYGALLNVPIRANLPVSYLTHGQRVPEDLLVAETDLMARYILERE